MKFLKVWTSFLELIRTLEYDEIGRLFEMMLVYTESGKEPESFSGNERFLWPVAKQQIDLAAAKNEILRQNGMRGGRPKSDETKQNQSEPNETKANQTKAYKEKESNVKESNIKEFIIDDDNTRDLHRIQAEHDQLLDAAENAGFSRSNSVRARLIDLYSVHGMEKMLAAIGSCVQHGVTNLAYLEAVLKGEPKKVKSNGYTQRDMSGAQEEAMARMIAAMKSEANGA